MNIKAASHRSGAPLLLLSDSPMQRIARRSRPISYILTEEQDNEGDVTFNNLVAIEQFVWQLFLPFLLPLVLLLRGRHFACNSGVSP